MPNGKHGNHPFNEIFTYGANLYGDGIDALVRELALHENFDQISERVIAFVGKTAPLWGKRTPEMDEAWEQDVRKQLAAFREELTS
ncbi:MAG: hypothetical protein AAFR61_07655 [Bacteroidota bacterium]